jgi:TM2 domain-containing membrane protein YozV
MADYDSKLSSDARAMMAYSARSKSTGIAYLLWLFFGWFGVHRFYLGNIGMGFLLLLSTLLGFVIFFTFIITVVVLIYDLFTIPSQVEKVNMRIMTEIGG